MGDLVSVAPDGIVVRDAGGEHRLRLDKTSYVRGFQGNKLTESEIPSVYQAGTGVIVAYEGDLVQTLRPQH